MPESQMTEQQAQDFMTLLIGAQKTTHVCPWCDYFKELAEQVLTGSQFSKRKYAKFFR